MPLYEKACLNGHRTTIYAHVPIERYCRTVICPQCGHTMMTTWTGDVRPLTYMRENHPMIVTNMGHEPLAFTSLKQHHDEMRKRGLAQPGVGRGMPGAWT